MLHNHQDKFTGERPGSGCHLRSAPRIGLALSSGAARGLAHVGVIQAIEELGVPIYAVAGCSMGAYIGALWNFGCSGAEMEKLAATINRPRDLLGLVDPAFPPGRGLIRGRKVKARLERTIGDARFSDMKRPLRVVATRLDTFERVVFSHGKVADAVHASLAIPGVCVPVELKGAHYSDGAILDPLPVEVLRRMGCDHIIAVSVIPRVSEMSAACGQFYEEKRPWLQGFNPFATGNFIDTLRRSVLSAEIRLADDSGRNADVLIEPEVREGGWHDYRQWPFYIERGRDAAFARTEELLALCADGEPDDSGKITKIYPIEKETDHYESIKA
ncbi:MAG: patatin-like phospholipase family protein [Verrucomicrobiales bacterium]